MLYCGFASGHPVRLLRKIHQRFPEFSSPRRYLHFTAGRRAFPLIVGCAARWRRRRARLKSARRRAARHAPAPVFWMEPPFGHGTYLSQIDALILQQPTSRSPSAVDRPMGSTAGRIGSG